MRTEGRAAVAGSAHERTAQSSVSRADACAGRLRELIADGVLLPGAPLREAELAAQFDVSRNTLREAFRILSQEGLVAQTPYRGACVATPSISAIIDIFRVRRMLESQALLQAFPGHPSISRMRAAVEAARAARAAEDWRGVGTANIAFHSAVVSLADSARLSRVFDGLAAELRLAFGLVADPEYLHAPFLDRNSEILALLESGDTAAAAAALDSYLVRAERLLLAAYEQLGAPAGDAAT